MRTPLIFLTLLSIAYPLSGLAAMYKCSSESSIVYQDTPCESGQAEINLTAAPNSGNPVEFKQEPLPPSQLQTTAIALGMTDTEVLNLRGWGRPARITRSKAQRAWHEEWTYSASADEQRQLHFANGKLAGIE